MGKHACPYSWDAFNHVSHASQLRSCTYVHYRLEALLHMHLCMQGHQNSVLCLEMYSPCTFFCVLPFLEWMSP